MDDATLKTLLAEDGLAERDPTFTYAVMQGVARRRLASDLFDLAPIALAVAGALWLLAPWIQGWVRDFDTDLVTPLAVGVIVALSLLAPMGLLSLRRMTET